MSLVYTNGYSVSILSHFTVAGNEHYTKSGLFPHGGERSASSDSYRQSAMLMGA